MAVVALWCLSAAAAAQTGFSLGNMPCGKRTESSANPDLMRMAEDDWIEGYLSARNLNGGRTEGDYLFGGGGLAFWKPWTDIVPATQPRQSRQP